jgi:hypothetical protein
MKRFIKRVILFGLILLCSAAVLWYVVPPANDKEWSVDQRILPFAEFNGDLVTIHNIRNFAYSSTTSYTQHYYDKTFDLRKIKSIDYIVEPFSGYKGAAHTFLSFGFEGDEYVAISVEIRKEKEESFSAVKGLFRQYELMYVVADERDVVKLRTNYRKDDVYMYPAKIAQEKMREIFLDMLTRANKLREKPEFYNTIANNCTTNIVSHVNRIKAGRIPFHISMIFPKHSDRFAYELGLIDTTLPFDEAQKKFHINERAMKYANDPKFSVRIRQ